MKHIIFTTTATLVLFSGVMCLPVAYANSYSSINNSVSVYSSSGGNVVSGKDGISGNNGAPGVIISGGASADMHVKTIVNGEVIQNINEHYEDQEDGIEIEKEFHYQSENGETEVNTNINITVNGSNKTDENINIQQTQEAQVLSYSSLDSVSSKEEIKNGDLSSLNNKNIAQPEGKNSSKPDAAKKSLIASIIHFFDYVFSLFTK